MSTKLKQWFSEPLVQFIALGAVIYGLYWVAGDSSEDEAGNQIVITEEQINSLAAGFGRLWNRPPTDEELLGLVREHVRETLLYREAMAMGLDKDDHIIRRRLAQKLEFLTNDLVKLREPAEDELQAFLVENMDEFRSPDQVTFTHVFLDPDARGDDTLAEAETLLAELNGQSQITQEEFLALGDRSLMQRSFDQASFREVQRQLGGGFAEQVLNLETGRWHGPVLSGFGVHLVYVDEIIRAPDPELADVRDDLLEAFYRQETEKFNTEYLNSLMERYEIVIEGEEGATS